MVSRGRLGAHVVDLVDELGRGARSRDWLPSQPAPATTSYLMGLGGRPGDRVLAVANPGDDEVRVALRVVTQGSEFAPTGTEELTVPPGATGALDLTGVLRARPPRGAIGVRLDSVAAGHRLPAHPRRRRPRPTPSSPARSRPGRRLASAARRRSRLVLAGAEQAGGVVTVTRCATSGGREVARERVAACGPGSRRASSCRAGATQLDVVVRAHHGGRRGRGRRRRRALAVVPLHRPAGSARPGRRRAARPALSDGRAERRVSSP